MVEKGDLMIQMDPQMAEVFRQSQAVSSKYLSTQSWLTNTKSFSYEGSVGLAPENLQQKTTHQAGDRWLAAGWRKGESAIQS